MPSWLMGGWENPRDKELLGLKSHFLAEVRNSFMKMPMMLLACMGRTAPGSSHDI